MQITRRAIPLLLLLVLLTGCYTVIQHRSSEQPVGYYSDCLECHHDGVEDYYVEDVYLLQGDSYSRYSPGTRYRYFHDSPWWWDYRYSEGEESEGEEDDSPLVRVLRRHRSPQSIMVQQQKQNVARVAGADESDDDEQEEEEKQTRKKKLKRRKH